MDAHSSAPAADNRRVRDDSEMDGTRRDMEALL